MNGWMAMCGPVKDHEYCNYVNLRWKKGRERGQVISFEKRCLDMASSL